MFQESNCSFDQLFKYYTEVELLTHEDIEFENCIPLENNTYLFVRLTNFVSSFKKKEAFKSRLLR